jgi:hypothetical protein
MMSRLKPIFSALVIIITVLFIIKSLKFKQIITPEETYIPDFQIISISENSRIFQDLAMQIPLTTVDTSFKSELRIKTDSQTAFELVYRETILDVLPGSYLHYVPDSKELSLIHGEVYWHRASKTPVSVFTSDGANPVTLSQKGRMLKSPEGKLMIWSYSGACVIKNDKEFIEIPPEKYVEFDAKNKPVFFDISPATTFISPVHKDVYVRKIPDLLIKLDWKSIPGVSEYKVKLYSSELRETLLLEKSVLINRTGIDLSEFEQNREFLWEVLPMSDNNIEGEPSAIGKIRVFGLLISEERDSRLPELAITSMTVNGNMILIRGNADISSELFIDEDPVKVDSNGIFIYTKRYKNLGLKKIIFRIVSPSGVESIQTKQVTIYEE